MLVKNKIFNDWNQPTSSTHFIADINWHLSSSVKTGGALFSAIVAAEITLKISKQVWWVFIHFDTGIKISIPQAVSNHFGLFLQINAMIKTAFSHRLRGSSQMKLILLHCNVPCIYNYVSGWFRWHILTVFLN